MLEREPGADARERGLAGLALELALGREVVDERGEARGDALERRVVGGGASASASQRDTTSASAPIASVAEDSAAVTSREANGRISPGAKPRPLVAYARTEARVGAEVVVAARRGTATRATRVAAGDVIAAEADMSKTPRGWARR